MEYLVTELTAAEAGNLQLFAEVKHQHCSWQHLPFQPLSSPASTITVAATAVAFCYQVQA